MSKAEDLAEKAYPEGDTYIFGDASIACKVAYVKGYHQAEKELELTWEDIKHIYDICCDVFNESDGYIPDVSKLWEEVLKRFNKERKEK